MFDSSEDRSVTKATLTEGKITLNKDSNPTQTTAQALGINTDLSKRPTGGSDEGILTKF
ncbi:hypothetical protein F480_00010 [Bibersteinia trehalosi Y31]|uniref:Uncharacterized protein n=1 Tax=Bibersteinia trehalosi Y31 TaxID=1261658 RepID=A0A179D0T0_BIBTR|nr:hypothetical protein F480_00010 [Bibersteinia trehalosi Y31]